jgi:hypothetical protein
MKSFFKLIASFIALSVMAFILSMLLGLLCTVLLGSLVFSMRVEGEGLLITIPIFYQVPVMFITWIISEVAMISGARGKRLYQIILSSSFYTSVIIAVMFYKIGWEYDPAKGFFIGLVAVAADILAILFFRHHLKTIC